MTRRIVMYTARTQPASQSRIAGQGLRRRGVTLIETIVLMTGVAAMLGLTVLMLQLLLKLDGDSRARFDRAGMLARLAEQFRRDVHGAGSGTARGANRQDPPCCGSSRGRIVPSSTRSRDRARSSASSLSRGNRCGPRATR